MRSVKPVAERQGASREVKRLAALENFLLKQELQKKYGTDPLQDAPNFFAEESVASATSNSAEASVAINSPWIPVRNVTPGIGLSSKGQLPPLAAMPPALDDFHLARFLVSPEDAKKLKLLAPMQPFSPIQQLSTTPSDAVADDMMVDEPQGIAPEPDTVPMEPSPKRAKVTEEQQAPVTASSKPVSLFVSLDDFIN